MSIINNMPSKGGSDVLGELKEYYVYTGETLIPGSFCEYVDGIGERPPMEFPITEYGGDVSVREYMERLGDTNKFLVRDSEGFFVAELNDGVFTYGTKVAYTSSYASFGCIVNSTQFLTYHWTSTTSKSYIYLYNIEGMVITRVTSLNYSTSEHSLFDGTYRLTDNKVFCPCSEGSFIVTVGATTLTKGTSLSLSYSSYTKARCVMNENLFLWAYASHSGSTSNRYLYPYVISGTTITSGSSVSLGSGAYYQPSNHIDGMVKINDNCAMCWYSSGGAHYFVPILCASDNTVSLGTVQNDEFTAAVSGSYPGYTCRYSEQQYAVLMRKRSEDSLRVLHKITADETGVLSFMLYPELLMTDPEVLQDSNNPVFYIYAPGSFIMNLYGNYFMHFTLPEVETQIKNATDGTANGVIKVGGIGGTILGGHEGKCTIYECPNITTEEEATTE